MKSWKKYEKDLTSFLDSKCGWEAIRRSRAMMGEEVMDIEWGPISIEAKCKANRPQYLESWLEQASQNRESMIPIVIWHQAYEGLEKDVVIMRLHSLLTLMQHIITDQGSDKYEIEKVLRELELWIEEAREKVRYK
jgi:hypothetical protein